MSLVEYADPNLMFGVYTGQKLEIMKRIVGRGFPTGRIPNRCKMMVICWIDITRTEADGVPMQGAQVVGFSYCSPNDHPVELQGRLIALERAIEKYEDVLNYGDSVPDCLYDLVSDWTGKVARIQTRQAAKEAALARRKYERQERHRLMIEERERAAETPPGLPLQKITNY